MARRAGGGETRGHVVGIRSSSVVRLMAGIAICRHGCIVVVCMALRTRDRKVGAGERESRLVMVEDRAGP